MANDVIASPPKREAMHAPEETQRSREVYRYFMPPRTAAPCSSNRAISAKHPSLLAHARLVALELGVSRVMISMMEHDTQWIIASHDQAHHSDEYGDGPDDSLSPDDEDILPNTYKLCLSTIEMQPPKLLGKAGTKIQDDSATYTSTAEEASSNHGPRDNPLPLNEIKDLSQHPRFSSLPFVANAPSLKYYCGCPLRTRKGYYIGSLCVFDSTPRVLSERDQRLLRKMAGTTINYLELMAKAKMVPNMLLLENSLSTFADTNTFGRNQASKRAPAASGEKGSEIVIPTTRTTAAVIVRSPQEVVGSEESQLSVPSLPGGAENRNSSMSSNASSLLSKGTIDSHLSLGSDGTFTPTTEVDLSETEPQISEAAFKGIFSRACAVIRDFLDVEGVIITDAGVGTREDLEANRWRLHEYRKSASSSRQVEILGVAARSTDGPSAFRVGQLETEFLKELLTKYPGGKIFCYGFQDGCNSSMEGHDHAIDLKKGSKYVKQNMSAFLPGSKTCICVPLFEDAGVPFGSLFVWTTQEKRVFVKEEIGYLKTFAYLIMSEVLRQNTLSAERAKDGFISNISHELRSPLHAIMGAADQFDEGNLSRAQKEFLEVMKNGANTLKDTLNNILDFAKLTRFQDDGRGIIKGHCLSDVDLAIVTEEVVKGVVTGFKFQGISRRSASKSPGAAGVIPLQPDGHAVQNRDQSAENTRVGIEVITDIQHIDNWLFRTDAGGFRRVLMNLVGNALKYTDQGYVRVKLEAEPCSDSGVASTNPTDERGVKVTLTVSDSGRGISKEFLPKLFQPFSQEDRLSAGTGLGMSIVRQLLDILGGTIHVKSEEGRGTDVTVVLYLNQSPTVDDELPKSSTLDDPFGVESTRPKDEWLSKVRAIVPKRRIALLGFGDDNPGLTFTKDSLARYSKDWYGMEVLEAETASSLTEFTGKADIVLLNETSPLLFELGMKSRKPPVIILCSRASKEILSKVEGAERDEVVDFVTKPCGPKNLAEILEHCLARSPPLQTDPGSSDPTSRNGPHRKLSAFTRQTFGHGPPQRLSSRSAIEDDLSMSLSETSPLTQAIESGETPISSSPGRPRPPISFIEDFNQLRFKAFAPLQVGLGSISGTMNMDGRNSAIVNPSSSHFVGSIHGAVDGSLIDEGTAVDRPPFASPVVEKDNPLRYQSLYIGDDEGPESQLTSAPILGRENLSTPKPTPIKSSASESSNTQTQAQLPHPGPDEKISVLIVDDNSLTMKVTASALSRAGFLVHEAGDGQSAIDEFCAYGKGFDVILMDLHLPVLSGLVATRTIRGIERDENRPQRTLIIAVTGDNNPAEALAAGCDEFFTKPLKMANLTAWIKKYNHENQQKRLVK